MWPWLMSGLGLLILLLPFVAWMLDVSLWQAFLFDLAIAIFYVVYGYAFNWAYDRVFPPPTKATALAEWCGERVGRCPQRSSAKLPPRLATAALCSASASLIGGSRPAKRCASIDLPVPGGPINSSECPPAAAISSARFAAAWPLTSARSA